MEAHMKKSVFYFAMFLLLYQTAWGQVSDSLIIHGKKILQQGFNSWSESELHASRMYFERMLASSNSDSSWLIHYYIGLSDWRLVAFYMGKQNKEKALQFLDEGIDHLQQCLELNGQFPEAHSLLSSLYGNKIGIKPMLAVALGTKSGIHFNKAISLDPTNPRSNLIAGQSAYFTPKLFGGGKDKAKSHIEKAIALFDSFKVANPVLPDWGHDEAFAWLGLIQADQGNFENAEKNYNNALAKNPNYGWVSRVLLPNLQKKRAESQK
jgi:tetratricopeptide (TPR) repeat protein